MTKFELSVNKLILLLTAHNNPHNSVEYLKNLARDFVTTILEAEQESYKKGLMSFDEHNEKRAQRYQNLNSPRTVNTGVACPNCGKELSFEDRGIRTASNPPKVHVKCECDWNGYLAW